MHGLLENARSVRDCRQINFVTLKVKFASNTNADICTYYLIQFWNWRWWSWLSAYVYKVSGKLLPLLENYYWFSKVSPNSHRDIIPYIISPCYSQTQTWLPLRKSFQLYFGSHIKCWKSWQLCCISSFLRCFL